jgi:hypothetical protein
MWNSIENDFVISAACLPSVPQFFRACMSSRQNSTTGSSFSRRTNLSSFTQLKPSSRPDEIEDGMAIELTRSEETPETLGHSRTNDSRRGGFAN